MGFGALGMTELYFLFLYFFICIFFFGGSSQKMRPPVSHIWNFILKIFVGEILYIASAAVFTHSNNISVNMLTY